MPVVTVANVITDAIRSKNNEGDGLSSDGSYGIWKSISNGVTNGGFEAGTSGWAGVVGTETLTRDTSAFKFGSASLKVDLPAASGAHGAQFAKSSSVANNAFIDSVWFKGVAGLGYVLEATNQSGTSRASTSWNASGAWEKKYIIAPMQGADTTMNLVVRRATRSGAETFYVDGAQIEAAGTTAVPNKSYPSPYVETSTGSSPRLSGAIQISSSLLAVQNGWLAIRWRSGFGMPDFLPSGTAVNYQLFGWGTSTTAQIAAVLGVGLSGPAVGTMTLARYVSGAGNLASKGSLSWAKDSIHTAVFYWSPTQLNIVLDGSSPSIASNSQNPDLSSFSTVYLGCYPGVQGNELDGDILWVAMGASALTTGEAQGICAL